MVPCCCTPLLFSGARYPMRSAVSWRNSQTPITFRSNRSAAHCDVLSRALLFILMQHMLMSNSLWLCGSPSRLCGPMAFKGMVRCCWRNIHCWCRRIWRTNFRRCWHLSMFIIPSATSTSWFRCAVETKSFHTSLLPYVDCFGLILFWRQTITFTYFTSLQLR